MKKSVLVLFLALLVGCGSLTKSLETGTASYINQSPAAVTVERTGKIERFSVEATGCFANSESAVENQVIAPAVQAELAKRHAYGAENVIASRLMAPTITDAITFGFIWGCSYWNVAGDLKY
jgi:hypothetical protein